MEEQIKKLQEELELVKKERDNLKLEMDKTFIKTILKDKISEYRKAYVKVELVNKDYIMAMYQTYERETIQELINNFGYDLVVECMVELFLTEAEENE
jgi:hypothetical protein